MSKERPISLVRKTIQLTPVQRRMFNVLIDGEKHRSEDLRKCLWDEMGDRSNVKQHIRNLRVKLAPEGFLILSEFYKRGYYYRMCVHMSSVEIK